MDIIGMHYHFLTQYTRLQVISSVINMIYWNTRCAVQLDQIYYFHLLTHNFTLHLHIAIECKMYHGSIPES